MLLNFFFLCGLLLQIIEVNASNDTTTKCFYVINQVNTALLDEICYPSNLVSFTKIETTTLTTDNSATLLFNHIATSMDLNKIWTLICGCLVFFMQAGFTMLEAGAVKASNTQNILFKNLVDACLGVLLWFIFGYQVAYGNDSTSNGFFGIGSKYLLLSNSDDYNSWFFQWAFAATSATIVSGAVAERCSLLAYFMYTTILTSWIYPVVVHWIWSDNGIFSAANPNAKFPIIDFAGSGVVHMVGGFSGLIGSIALGPRIGRFDKKLKSKMNIYDTRLQIQLKFGNNVSYQTIGAMILWFGWYGFNAGSTLAATNSMDIASKVAVTTTLSAVSGGLFTAFAGYYLEGFFMVPRVLNGILAGLVGITGPCAVVSIGSSIGIGFISGFVYYTLSNFMERLNIDDPLDAFAVHGGCGIIGVLSVAIFSDKNTRLYAGYDILANYSKGKLFSHQLLAVICIILWTCLWNIIIFYTLKCIKYKNGNNLLRISNAAEKIGLDQYKHGGILEMGSVDESKDNN